MCSSMPCAAATPLDAHPGEPAARSTGASSRSGSARSGRHAERLGAINPRPGRAEDLRELVRSRDLELIVSAVRRLLVRAASAGRSPRAGSDRLACGRISPRTTRSMRSGSHDEILPGAPAALAAGHALIAWPAASAHCRQGCASIALVRSEASPATSARRVAIVNADVTPTCCSFPWSSYSPRSSDPIASFPLLCQRKPATTQSAVRTCLILIMARLPGWYGASTGLAMTPSSPAPSKRDSHSRASAASRVIGVR